MHNPGLSRHLPTRRRFGMHTLWRGLMGLMGLLSICGCSDNDPANWKRVDGRWTFQGSPFDAADPASFKVLDGLFARDAVQGYYRGRPVPGSHGPSFEVLGENEARDRAAVYWADTYRKGQEYYMLRHAQIHTIAEADPARYQVLKYGYGRDGQRAYAKGQRLPGVRDPASFEVLTPRLSRDARRAYFEDIEIPDSDGASFEIIDVHVDAWVRDRQRAWHVRYGMVPPDMEYRREVRLLEAAQPASLRPLGREYASDGRRVWWRGQQLKNADAASFAVIEDQPGRDEHLPDAQDAAGPFRQGQRLKAGKP